MQKNKLTKNEFVRSHPHSSNLIPAPNAQRSVAMMAQFRDREYKSLLPPIAKSVLDPNFPKQLADW